MFKAVVIGTSYGGLDALKLIFPRLNKDFPIPVIVVLHIGSHRNDVFVDHLNSICQLPVKEVDEGEPVLSGHIYFAPPNYHLLVNDNYTFALSADGKVNFSRPSIDVLFESAAWVYKKTLIGVILTGANSDGAVGMKTIKRLGGTTIVQNPSGAISPVMPEFAIEASTPDFVLEIEDIAEKLNELARIV